MIDHGLVTPRVRPSVNHAHVHSLNIAAAVALTVGVLRVIGRVLPVVVAPHVVAELVRVGVIIEAVRAHHGIARRVERSEKIAAGKGRV